MTTLMIVKLNKQTHPEHGGSWTLCFTVNITRHKQETLTKAVLFFRSSLLRRGHLVTTTFTFCLPLLVLVCTQWARPTCRTLYHLSSGAVSCNISMIVDTLATIQTTNFHFSYPNHDVSWQLLTILRHRSSWPIRSNATRQIQHRHRRPMSNKVLKVW